MANTKFKIGQRVNVRGRTDRYNQPILFSLVDIDEKRGRAKVVTIIYDQGDGNRQGIGWTNGDAEWVELERLIEFVGVYTWMKYFNNIQKYKAYFEDLETNPRRSDQLKAQLVRLDEWAEGKIEAQDPKWFPIPNSAPEDLEALKRKTTWTDAQMDYYWEFKKNYLDDFLRELMFESFADVKEPEFIYNDRQLGEFDFAKASVGLTKRFIYYSVKHKKVVPFQDVEIVNLGDKFEYKLKLDGSEVVIRADEDSSGNPKYYSTVKKSYLLKEVIQRPKNAVRIFLYQETNSYWSADASNILLPAMTAIALTELLQSLDYSVSFVAGWDASQCLMPNNPQGVRNRAIALEQDESKVQAGIYNPKRKGWVQGERFCMYNVKKYEENLNIPELLYLVADPALYGWGAQRNMFLLMDEYGDKWIDDKVGYRGDETNWEQTMYANFLPRDSNKGVLYITIKGIQSVDGVKAKVRNIIRYVEEQNRLMREQLGVKEW